MNINGVNTRPAAEVQRHAGADDTRVVGGAASHGAPADQVEVSGDAQAVASASQRLDAFADTVAARLEGLASELGGEEAKGLSAAGQDFAGHVQRLHDALAGGMSLDSFATGLQNALGLLKEGVGAALQPAASDDVAPSAEDPATSVGEDRLTGNADAQAAREQSVQRVDAFAATVAERILSLGEGADPAQAAALAKVAEGFEASMARLESALFETGSIDRDQFQQQFESLLDRLREGLGPLLDGGDDPAA